MIKMKMNSKFPFSMESIPRQKSFGCLSLKFGCIFSALVIILYTVLALAQCLAAFNILNPSEAKLDSYENIFMYCFTIVVILCHIVTLILTTIMLVGILREKSHLMQPWLIWTTCQVTIGLLLIVFWTAINMAYNHADGSSLMLYVIAFLGLLIRIYMLMLVASYYMQLVEEGIERRKMLLANDTWYSTA